MLKRFVYFLAVMGMISTPIFTGCGGDRIPDGMPPLVKFTLTITQDGKLLDDATVTFRTTTHSYKVDGKTNGSGVVQFLTNGKYKGTPEGEYDVEVKKHIATVSKFGNEAPLNPEARARWDADRLGEYRPIHSFVEEKYGSFETSDLTVNIVNGGKETLDVGSAVDDVIIPAGSSSNPNGEETTVAPNSDGDR